MKKNLASLIVVVFVLAFAFGTLVPTSHAVVPKKTICWTECIGTHVVECCRYVIPGGPNFVQCEDTGYFCPF